MIIYSQSEADEMIKAFEPFLDKIENKAHAGQMSDLLNWVAANYPNLKPELKWNQPMFTDHGTYIIGFSAAKAHISVAPEYKAMEKFEAQIKQAGYTQTKGLFRIKFTDQVDEQLLKEIIDYNIEDKKGVDTFWRK